MPLRDEFADRGANVVANLDEVTAVTRLETLDEVADAVVRPCSDEASFVTGEASSSKAAISAGDVARR